MGYYGSFVGLNMLAGKFLLLTSLLVLVVTSNGYSAEFKISDLKKGQEVTLTGRSTTVIPYGESFYVAATDLPQTVSFSQIWKGNKKNDPKLKIAIYDKSNDKVKYLNLKKSVPFIYSLRNTERVLIVPEKAKGKKVLSLMKNQRIHVRSSKPLTVAR